MCSFAVLYFSSKPIESKDIIKIYRDTILRIDSFYITNIKLDTVIQTKTDTLFFNGYEIPISEYHYKINDSLLTGTIIAKAPFKPSIDFKYNIKSYTIKDSIYIEKTPLNAFYYGGEVVVSPLFSQIYLGLDYQDKKGSIYGFAVGRDFELKNNLIKLSYKKRF